jgi:hypothetical protein
MYILDLHFKNACRNDTGRFRFPKYKGKIRKWTLFSSGPSKLELLRFVAIACGGVKFLPKLPFQFLELLDFPEIPLQLEFVLAPHPGQDYGENLPACYGSGIQIKYGQHPIAFCKKMEFLPAGLSTRKPAFGTGNSSYFILGYGHDIIPHRGTDDFDFLDPFFRITRFHTLFNKDAHVTDPVEFLHRLRFKIVRAGRYLPTKILKILDDLFQENFDIDIGSWFYDSSDFKKKWDRLQPWQRRAVLIPLDVARHLLDAFPQSNNPTDKKGIILLDRPDRICTPRIFPKWITLMDRFLPNMQFIVTVSKSTISNFPVEADRKRLVLPTGNKNKGKETPKKIPQRSVLLIHLDGRLPNLALMKLSRYFKEKGRNVVLARGAPKIKGAGEVYASCVYAIPASAKKVKILRNYYGKSLVIGGSGVDLNLRLDAEIEKLPPDYSLYPELGEHAMGFITRGCPSKCPFCLVPEKEGNVHQVSTLNDLLPNGQNKLILLDDNILSHPESGNFLEEMALRDIQVNFTQTLDIRFLNKEKIRLIRRIKCSNLKFTRRVYHFSLNDTRNIDLYKRKYPLLGFTRRDNVEFICMYGFNTTLAEDVERFRFLRSLPGAYVFVQRYQPIPGGPPPDLDNYFNGDVDTLIEELVTIVFTQNMKSMEVYYRWLSREYAKKYGKLHNGLVDTIFKYNSRQQKGRYLATLAGTRKE